MLDCPEGLIAVILTIRGLTTLVATSFGVHLSSSLVMPMRGVSIATVILAICMVPVQEWSFWDGSFVIYKETKAPKPADSKFCAILSCNSL